jgi:hypothetical protein
LEESKQSLQLGGVDTGNCTCESRQLDQEVKKTIMTEIVLAYEEIIQLEQALIELDEQNTLNALEIRKREAKVFILQRQLDDYLEHHEGEDTATNEAAEIAQINRHI